MGRSLGGCRTELRLIINELRSIEAGIRNDFKGIGENMCAGCVSRIAGNYEKVLSRLNNVNQNRLAEWVYGEE